MRLCKKAAACLLAAVMAVSMLTACGGDAGGGSAGGGSTGGGSTGGGSNPGGEDTFITVPKSDEIDLGDIGNDDAGSKTHIVSTQSMYYKYLQKVEAASEAYQELLATQYDADGVAIMEIAQVTAKKDNWGYLAMTIKEKSDPEVHKLRYVLKKEDSGKVYQYTTFDEGSYAIKATGGLNGENIFDSDAAQLPQNMYKTKVKVNNTEYDAETYAVTVGGARADAVICLDKAGNPVYIIVKYNVPQEGVSMSVTALKPVQYNSKGLCALKSNCKIYTETEHDLAKGTMKLQGPDNKIYLVSEDWNNNNRLTVTDESNADVTNQFQWLSKADT